MTKLSVNINKIATLRNSRGGHYPDVIQAAIDIQKFGADGITVHPRPDERHIRYDDVRQLTQLFHPSLLRKPGRPMDAALDSNFDQDSMYSYSPDQNPSSAFHHQPSRLSRHESDEIFGLKKIISTEFNIEGNPIEQKFVNLVLEVRPHQVTLVPDALGQITSNHGWDTIQHQKYLREIIPVFQKVGIRVSIFVDPDVAMVEGAAATGTDRIELYTEGYAKLFEKGEQEEAAAPYVAAAKKAQELGLGLNAGHDLDLKNLKFFKQSIPWLDEVSIGHALISDALYLGLEKTIQRYKEELE
ncbi:MAG: pyridoxine 5'-phosphate synthase [Chthoniobacterales bacterium]|nr:pyridoxine 5'-phosphate synthase [Chthoniobacterales bacterium]